MQRTFKTLFKRHYIYTLSLWNLFKTTLYTTCFDRHWSSSDQLAVCLCVYPPNFRMPKPICMKLGMYIMTPEPISTAYFINPFHQFVPVCVPPYCCWAGARYTRSRVNEYKQQKKCWARRLLRGLCRFKGESVLCIPLSLLGNGSEHFPAAMKNCWMRRFLCGPCEIKGK
jgi:hypothetical protein